EIGHRDNLEPARLFVSFSMFSPWPARSDNPCAQRLRHVNPFNWLLSLPLLVEFFKGYDTDVRLVGLVDVGEAHSEIVFEDRLDELRLPRARRQDKRAAAGIENH